MAATVPTDLAAMLVREWHHIARRTELISRARSWHITHLAFEDLDELLALAGYRSERMTHPDHPNAVLAALVDAARHDPLAGRVVLQRILPGLLAACRRWRHGCLPAGVTSEEVLGELVGTAWTVITSYSTRHRPRNVAANVLSDTVYRAFVAPSRRKSGGERPLDPAHFTVVPDDERRPSAVELVEVLRDAEESGVDPGHVTLLRDLVRAGGSAEQVAAVRKVTGRAVRSGRAKAIAAVRAVACAA